MGNKLHTPTKRKPSFKLTSLGCLEYAPGYEAAKALPPRALMVELYCAIYGPSSDGTYGSPKCGNQHCFNPHHMRYTPSALDYQLRPGLKCKKEDK